MKIVVYNSHGQYALSRAEVAAIHQTVPQEMWAPVHELHLAHSHPQQKEKFEFDAQLSIGYLIMPVSQKSSASRAEAITELLVGLARVKEGSRFFLPVKDRERAEYQEFVSHWLPLCEAAIGRLHAAPDD